MLWARRALLARAVVVPVECDRLQGSLLLPRRRIPVAVRSTASAMSNTTGTCICAGSEQTHRNTTPSASAAVRARESRHFSGVGSNRSFISARHRHTPETSLCHQCRGGEGSTVGLQRVRTRRPASESLARTSVRISRASAVRVRREGYPRASAPATGFTPARPTWALQ